MSKGCFVTGTDTGVGKTWCAVALMRHLKSRGMTVAGMKPVAAGCELRSGRLLNEDALLLQENASKRFPYEWVNPYAFALPVSPHIAAARSGQRIELEKIEYEFCRLSHWAEAVVVEGAGGWRAPITDSESMEDLARMLKLPVVLVVSIRLGCINHAVLTNEAIVATGLPMAGWIANCTHPEMPEMQENIETLKRAIRSPPLGVLPYMSIPDFDLLAKKIG
ncbi:MAG: dethiobiotin synthase [Gammaproteobacteria bacterium]